jgi:methylmalonyl-CoA mutase
VGVNNYPNLTEKTAEAARQPERRGLSRLSPGEPFEKIRRRTKRHAAKTGRVSEGAAAQARRRQDAHGARANFSLNFLGCAGFDVVESEEYEGTDADLIVLCSSDPEYLALAQEVCPRVKVPVLVAGNPKEQIDALQGRRRAGLHSHPKRRRPDPDEWQERLGMRSSHETGLFENRLPAGPRPLPPRPRRATGG